MAISTVRVKVNGFWTNLTYNEESGLYEGTLTAPSITSYHNAGGYYPVTVEAANDAGTVVTKDDTDAALGSSLRLIVKERVKPVITLLSPTNGAYTQNNQQTISFTVTDETNGSGVKEGSIVFLVDGAAVEFVKSETENGWECSYTPATALVDGLHTISINAEDNDGNIAEAIGSTFTVDTIPPTLDVFVSGRAITNNPAVTVSGITNDETSSPVAVEITHNGDVLTVSVNSDGTFAKDYTMTEGTNTFTVVSTDSAGRSTTVTKVVKLDTTIPEVTNIRFDPNPTDTSGSVRITMQVR